MTTLLVLSLILIAATLACWIALYLLNKKVLPKAESLAQCLQDFIAINERLQ